ncbi:MAG: AAA family ATPase [Actinomycetota bacterium]|nr:AAA family ATPase [Actinomycetota bacterium]
MTKRPAPPIPPHVAEQIAHEQAYVDRVYAELIKAGERARLVEAEGLHRGFSDRGGAIRDDEITNLFQRDALVFNAGRRRQALETQYEGLVFGRLDLAEDVRYIGRLGVRDDEYEPLVIDWRAPAAAPFYRATPGDPLGVVRRRVLRCRDAQVIGIEDDLMVAQAPDGMVVVGDGALMAALSRSRGGRMRDIVATIQQHQDEAIRASSRGVTEITGGPGTGKTVVALHRAAYLLYSNRRKFENGGILVVGPSSSYTAYIERVLPSLGEDSVSLRSLGDVVAGITAHRLDTPSAARVKGSLNIRQVLARAAHDLPPDAPMELRTMVAGSPVRIQAAELTRLRRKVLRGHHHNTARKVALDALTDAAWAQVRSGEKAEFVVEFHEHRVVESFLAQWWAPLDARAVLSWLAIPERLVAYTEGVLSEADHAALAASMAYAASDGTWSVADVALIDDIAARLGPIPEAPKEERGFYEIEELEDVQRYGVTEVGSGGRGVASDNRSQRSIPDPAQRLLAGHLGEVEEYAHILIDEAQDLSPMQWRMIGRRGHRASWTVVGDAAQSSWPVQEEAARARDEAFGQAPRQRFHMGTNYRNAREIFDYAAAVVRAQVPDADIPEAVRETGIDPQVLHVAAADIGVAAHDAAMGLLDEVDGLVAVIAPERHRERVTAALRPHPRIVLVDPMSTKGLEYDATVVVDPDEITAESPGGVRVLYVALTRAAHRMTVIGLSETEPS